MLLFAIAAGMTTLLLLSSTIHQDLLATLTRWHLISAGGGLMLHLIGCVAPQPFGHLCLIIGGGGLLWGGRVYWRWRWGWLIWSGIGCNQLAIAWYDRMPVHVHTIAALGLALPKGSIIPGSKDVVADGPLAWWLGDRFLVPLPVLHIPLLWSVGDGILLAGVCLVVVSSMWRRFLILSPVWHRTTRGA